MRHMVVEPPLIVQDGEVDMVQLEEVFETAR